MKNLLIKLFTFLGGLYFFLEFVIPENINGFKFGAYHEEISTGLVVIGTMSIGLGLINILIVHLPRIVFLKKNYFNSLALLLGFFVMLTLAALDWTQSEQIRRESRHVQMLKAFGEKIMEEGNASGKVLLMQEEIKQLLQKQYYHDQPDQYLEEKQISKFQESYSNLDAFAGKQNNTVTKDFLTELDAFAVFTADLQRAKYEESTISGLYNLFFNGFFISLATAMFSLLAFFVASAAYRSFRIKTLESTVLMIAACLVILGQIPFGIWLWDGFPVVRQWLLEVPNSAVFRAISLGGGIAGLILAVRMWLSIETDLKRE